MHDFTEAIFDHLIFLLQIYISILNLLLIFLRYKFKIYSQSSFFFQFFREVPLKVFQNVNILLFLISQDLVPCNGFIERSIQRMQMSESLFELHSQDNFHLMRLSFLLQLILHFLNIIVLLSYYLSQPLNLLFKILYPCVLSVEFFFFNIQNSLEPVFFFLQDSVALIENFYNLHFVITFIGIFN